MAFRHDHQPQQLEIELTTRPAGPGSSSRWRRSRSRCPRAARPRRRPPTTHDPRRAPVTDRRGAGRGQPDDDRPAALLVRLRRPPQELLARVRDQDQRAEPGRRLEGRDHRHRGQQDEQGPGGAGRRRRRPLLRPDRARRPATSRPTRSRPGTSIPATAKDADGFWYGDYYGVLSFEVNTAKVHERAAGLERPAQARVQGPGRPRRRSDRVEPGHRRASGRRASPPAARSTTPRRASTSSRSSTTPATSCRSSPRPPTSPPATRRSASRGPTTPSPTRTRSRATRPSPSSSRSRAASVAMYVQAISAFAPHPNAAKLWMEYLYSDAGQNIWLEGLLQPDPLRRHGHEGHRRQGGPGRSAGHRRAPCSRPSTRSPRRPK